MPVLLLFRKMGLKNNERCHKKFKICRVLFFRFGVCEKSVFRMHVWKIEGNLR